MPRWEWADKYCSGARVILRYCTSQWAHTFVQISGASISSLRFNLILPRRDILFLRPSGERYKSGGGREDFAGQQPRVCLCWKNRRQGTMLDSQATVQSATRVQRVELGPPKTFPPFLLHTDLGEHSCRNPLCLPLFRKKFTDTTFLTS